MFLRYRFYTGVPLWPFGFGLSYSNITLAWQSSDPLVMTTMQAHPPSVGASVVVNVTNHGPMAAAKVVQAFIQASSQDGPHRQLFGIEKVRKHTKKVT